GPATVIEPEFTSDVGPLVVGGAVAYWTAIVGADGTINVWTKAGGTRRALSTTSPVGLFAATEDGSRVAFTTGVVGDAADLAVVDTTTTTPTVVPLLAEGERINLLAFDCPPVFGFAGSNLVASFCVGTDFDVTDAHLYFVPKEASGGTPAAVRLDDVGAG